MRAGFRREIRMSAELSRAKILSVPCSIEREEGNARYNVSGKSDLLPLIKCDVQVICSEAVMPARLLFY